MIGVIGAMEVEVNAIIDMLNNKKEMVVGPITFTLGIINGKDVVVAKCGIGKVFAAMCAESMIQNFKLDYLLNVGVAGSLSKNLNVASIAISKSCVQHDMDTSPLGDPVGMISGINIIEIPASKAVIWKVEEAVKSLGIDYEIGVIASGDQFVNSSEKKDYIFKTFNAIACEMEGAAIGHAAYLNRIPFLIIRAISDKADDSATVDYPTFEAKAIEYSVKLLLELCNRL